MKLKRILDSLTYEKQMFIKLMALVTIPMIIMGIVSSLIYVNGESARSELQLQSYSEQITREYENVFSSLKEYYIEVANEDAVRWLAQQEKAPYSMYSDLNRAQDSLQGNYFVEKYVESYEFINVRSGWILDDYGMFDYDELKNREEAEQFLEAQKEVPLSAYWIKAKDSEKYGNHNLRKQNTVDLSGFRLVIKKEYGAGDLAWIIVVKINESKIRQLLPSNYENMGYSVSVLSDQSVMAETNQKLTQIWLEKFSEEKDWGAFDSEGTLQIGKTTKYSISRTSGATSGLTYLVGFNHNQIRKIGMTFIFASFAVIAVIAVLIQIVRVLVLAFANPLNKLELHVKERDIQLKEFLLSNLIKGEMNEGKIKDALGKYQITEYSSYRMLGMACKENDNKEILKREIYTGILETLPEEIQSKIFITPLFYGDKMIFVAGGEDDNAAENQTAVIYKEVKDFIAEHFLYHVSCGISQTFHHLTDMQQAYNECNEALYDQTNANKSEGSTLVLFDDYSMLKRESNVYDIIMEGELVQAIENCNVEESQRLLETMIERLDSKHVIGVERNFYLTRLLTVIVGTTVTHGLLLEDVFMDSQYNTFNRIPMLYDTEKLKEAIIKEVIQPIIESLQKLEDGDEMGIFQQIQKLVRENRGNITLSECAQTLNYHPNYIGKIIKKEKNITFTDMVNEEKLMQAKYMLLTTEMSVAEISEILMYNNVQNFIRFFKKHIGVTPAAFRKEH